MHGVSRQAVLWHKQTYGGYLTYRQVVNKAWPWKTTNLHGKSKVYQRLRDHGDYMLTQGIAPIPTLGRGSCGSRSVPQQRTTPPRLIRTTTTERPRKVIALTEIPH